MYTISVLKWKKKGKSNSLSRFSVLYDCLILKTNNPKPNSAINIPVDTISAILTPVDIVLPSGGGGGGVVGGLAIYFPTGTMVSHYFSIKLLPRFISPPNES